MNPEQALVIESLINCKNVMMLGVAGTGKSQIIKHLKEYITDKNIFLTSTTGVSALSINGSTVHSFFGVGLGDKPIDYLYKRILSNDEVKCRLRKPNLLIVIDEVSMLSSELLTKIDGILRRIRRNQSIFGGAQMLFSGDFMQLETINADNILENDLIKDFQIIELKQNYRQQADRQFQELLGRMRINDLTNDDNILLESKENKEVNPDIIRIFCVNSKVSKYNTEKFNLLPGNIVSYTAKFSGSSKETVANMKKQFIAKDAEILKLKIGVRVMLIWNVDISLGLVNGSTGTVISCERTAVLVDFDLAGRHLISKQCWTITDDSNKVLSKTEQIPLIISYALSVHKCQGITLDSAVIDLSSAFCNHQIYVALSRVKSLDGITLVNYNKNKVKVNQKIIKFYDNLYL
jgi:ATP-dependent DNA helicase PIF1